MSVSLPNEDAYRRQAHDLGLPWIEDDGSLSWAEPAISVHESLHAARMEAQPEVLGRVRINPDEN
jgi:hypothetical protein